MRDYYSIFGCINYLEDQQEETRGLRKRPVDTKIFVLSGAINLKIEKNGYQVNAGDEFIIPKNKWHGWKSLKGTRIIQMLEKYNEAEEKRLPYDVI